MRGVPNSLGLVGIGRLTYFGDDMNRNKLLETTQDIRIVCNTLEGNIAGNASNKILENRVQEIVQLVYKLLEATFEG